MATQIQFRRGLSTEWTSVNPILAQGEMGLELDTNKAKIGDGVQNWNALPYSGIVGPQGPQGDVGPQGIQGEQGIQGLQGIQGIKGDTGDQGPQGLQGEPGVGIQLKGSVSLIADLPSSGNVIGDSYIVDEDGDLYTWSGSAWSSVGQIVGPQGPQGIQGATGAQGEQGIQGIQGIQGVQGEKGDKGDTGDTGPQGPQGETGLSLPADFENVVIVSKNGNDSTGDGSLNKPYLTIAAAMTSITDAAPSKRYIIKVEAGPYTEGALLLKPNVFIVGDLKEAVRITASSVAMDPSFNAPSSQDHRSGMGRVILTGACTFDWLAVSSTAGKLYFTEVAFVSAVTMNGGTNAIAQAQFDSCQFFGALTISGINVGVFKDNICFNNITLNQHPNGGMASILVATGGYCGGTLRLNTTVNDFGRRCSAFLRGFWSENLIVDGVSSYADVDLVSYGKTSTQKLNGGNVIALNPKIYQDLETQMIKPLTTNAHNSGDWGRQWFFNFNYVNGSSGTDLYLISTMGSYDPAGDTSGRNLFINSDAYGLQSNVNGGNIELETAATSGSGVRGKVQVKARELDVTSSKITNLADGTVSSDAINLGQLTSAFSSKYRAGSVSLGNGVDAVSVTFSSAMPTADYTITYSLVNAVDVNPKYLHTIVTSKSTSGFNLKMHQPTDSANYLLEYIVIVHA